MQKALDAFERMECQHAIRQLILAVPDDDISREALLLAHLAGFAVPKGKLGEAMLAVSGTEQKGPTVVEVPPWQVPQQVLVLSGENVLNAQPRPICSIRVVPPTVLSRNRPGAIRGRPPLETP